MNETNEALTPTGEEPEKKRATISTLDPANYYRTAEYKSIYANVCQVTVSPWDVQILFCRGGRMLGQTKIEEVATAYLSPAQAKSLLGVLAGQIHKFEQQHGVIGGSDLTVELVPETLPASPAIVQTKKKKK